MRIVQAAVHRARGGRRSWRTPVTRSRGHCTEEGNPSHRARIEHNRDTTLVHLSGEDGSGWTVLAVDRASRRWAVGQARGQLDAAEEAFGRLYDRGQP